MTIEQLTAASRTSAKDGDDTATEVKNPLGQDVFMKLLLTQLQNQDPTSPQADGEFLAQLAQFSQLEQLQEMNKKLDAMATFFSAVNSTTTTESSNTSTATERAATAPIAGSN